MFTFTEAVVYALIVMGLIYFIEWLIDFWFSWPFEE